MPEHHPDRPEHHPDRMPEHHIDRRLFLRAGAATGAALAVGTSAGAQPATAAPTDGGVPYMVYEAGERLAGAIAVARG